MDQTFYMAAHIIEPVLPFTLWQSMYYNCVCSIKEFEKAIFFQDNIYLEVRPSYQLVSRTSQSTCWLIVQSTCPPSLPVGWLVSPHHLLVYLLAGVHVLTSGTHVGLSEVDLSLFPVISLL